MSNPQEKSSINKLLASCLVLVTLICLFLAYQLYQVGQTPPPQPEAEVTPPVVQTKAPETMTIGMATTKKDTSALTSISTTAMDFNADGKEDEVKLFTAAQKDASGKIMWDDGQNWLLLVTIGDKEYQLFDGYVQIGELVPYVYTSGDNECHISLLQPGSASMTFTDFKYDPLSEEFEKIILYDPENVNLR